MKRKTSTTPTRIYSYYCFPPIIGGDLLEQQIQRAHRYKNTLIEIELRRRERVLEEMNKYGDVGSLTENINTILEELADTRKTIKAKRAGVGRRADTKEENQHAKDLLTALKEKREALRSAKKEIKDNLELRAQLRAIEDRARAEVREERSRNGLYWGTYLVVEQAVQLARKSITPPRFAKYTGEGRIAVEIMHGMTTQELFSREDTRLRLLPPSPEAFLKGTTRSRREKLCRPKVKVTRDTKTHELKTASCTGGPVVSIRAGSNEDRSPRWVELPVIIHRPLPDDAIIKWAWIHRRRAELNYEYRLQLVFESKTFDPPTLAPGKGTAAIGFGWRNLFAGGIRVGYLVDDSGREEEFKVPEKTIVGLQKTDELRSIRDKNFDQAKLELIKFCDSVKTLPEWLKPKITHIEKWRSPGRLVSLLNTWSENRFANSGLEDDNWIFNQLSSWAKQDRHLYKWEWNQRDRRLGLRREIYRKLAFRLANTYSRILMPKFDLTKYAAQRLPEDGVPSDGHTQRFTARLAAPGELRSAIRYAAQKLGVEVIEIDAPYSTIECHVCHSREPWNAAPEIMHTCASCNAKWDQDANQGYNLLHLVSSGSVIEKTEESLEGGNGLETDGISMADAPQ